MKTKQKTLSTAPMKAEKQHLFDSILSNETLQRNDFICQQQASRVGLILKVLYNRELFTLRNDFERDLSNLIQDYANKIDDELHSTGKN